jgi:hypothetical protein
VSLTSNTAGRMYALTVFTPVIADRVEGLRAVLAELPRLPSPLARLAATHFARWVIIPDFVSDASQPAPEHLPSPYLLFSATFDGTLDQYLDDLCEALATEAQEIWGCCVGAPAPPRGEALKAYLRHNQIQTGLFFSAYPQADVETVKAALVLRAKTIDFAVRSQGMGPQELHRAFLEEFPS